MNEGLKSISANDEIRIALDCINLGISHIAKWDGKGYEYFIPLLLLSTGFERLMKILLCLKYFDEYGSYPSTTDFNQHIGKIHDIETLMTKILEILKNNPLYGFAPDRKADIGFLENDKDIKWLISLLSDFAKHSRYHNLNVMIDNGKSKEDPWDSISQFRTQYFIAHFQLQNEVLLQDLTPFYTEVHSHLIGIIQRFTRVLCFCFTQGAFGSTARQVSAGLLDDFMFLKDEQIGDISFWNLTHLSS